MELLEFIYVNKNFGNKKILKDINLFISNYWLFRKNGAGKSTLIKLVNDLLTPSDRQILINGQIIGIESKKWFLIYQKESI